MPTPGHGSGLIACAVVLLCVICKTSHADPSFGVDGDCPIPQQAFAHARGFLDSLDHVELGESWQGQLLDLQDRGAVFAATMRDLWLGTADTQPDAGDCLVTLAVEAKGLW